LLDWGGGGGGFFGQFILPRPVSASGRCYCDDWVPRTTGPMTCYTRAPVSASAYTASMWIQFFAQRASNIVEGPPFHVEGPLFNVEGPPFLVEGPPFHVEGPPFNVEGPPFYEEGSPI
jgi:hypothetical protein